MTSFAERCGIAGPARETATRQLLQRLRDERIQQVRIGWCDLHGTLRGKTLMPNAVHDAVENGLGMVGTVLLKDTSDRTAFKVFERGGLDELSGFEMAGNLLLLPDPHSLTVLPWAPGTAWLRAQPWFGDAEPVTVDPRHVLQRALRRLAKTGHGLRCGLEVEFHVYRITAEPLDPMQAAWPAAPPEVALVHPGYNLLSEGWADRAHEVLSIARETALGLQLPLRSLEIELGPSQFEAVFDPVDALVAADHMVLFRNGVKQALHRAGYHATFMCRPPFPNAMASGWHLHQSLTELSSGGNAFMREFSAPGSSAADARATLSDIGTHYLAGLMAHAASTAVFAASTVNAYGRFRPNALAPTAPLWGRDNRGAMLRVLGGPGEAGTRIENRLGEPMANPYLYVASQVYAGMSGMQHQLVPGAATDAPYAEAGPRLPATLDAAVDALEADVALCASFGPELVRLLTRIKRSESLRHAQAEDKDDWQRREYFSRY